MDRTLVLASASPRRKSLLKMLDVDFQVHHADIDESIIESEMPDVYVARLAKAKAEAVHSDLVRQYERLIVLGSDTTVVAEGSILGKPESFEDACRMLSMLSGVWHDVYTAVCVLDCARSEQVIVQSRVKFRPVSRQDMSWYWNTGEPADKAGAYGIQGHGGVFVERIDGSYSSIVGLPLCETSMLLNKFGIKMGSMNHHE
ncbi:septum formation protein Maf [Hahella sp. CCB-MM4]|uniref:Maf family protein n=1 Tax=Hahella sp. (strain CCB-MM4) TaxID=1926491 RepID=UPI000B9B887C|nr:Maf family protein [Hahella sp. CCB-MM4]OZG70552.1 septum formation protein Maf [Hahella sp. CCB-MM4]